MHYAPIALVVVLFATTLYIAQAALLSIEPRHQNLPIDVRESASLLSGIHDIERDQRSTFRWSNGHTTINWYPRGTPQATVLSLFLGSPPPELVGMPLQLRAGGQFLAQWAIDTQPRRYYILQPRSLSQGTRITAELTSAAVMVPPDSRPVSVRIEAIALQGIGGQLWPRISMVLVQTLTLLLGGVLLSMLGRRRWVVFGIAAIGVGLSAVFVAQPLLYTPHVVRLTSALAGLLLGSWIALPHFTRFVAWAGPASFARAVLGLAIFACVVRLIGSLYPLFRAYGSAAQSRTLLSCRPGEPDCIQ